MIYVTTGHEKSISVEIFAKSISKISQDDLSNLTLVCVREKLLKNLVDLNISHSLNETHLVINKKQVKVLQCTGPAPSSTLTLLKALEVIKSNDILLTLPTSKDQLIYEGDTCLGYTEFLRKYFKRSITMTFLSDNDLIGLVTDHIPLSRVNESLSSENIYQKIHNILNSFPQYFHKINRLFITGINPHAGENGLLGNDQEILSPVIERLRQNFSDITIGGIFPADSIFQQAQDNSDLVIYMYHDQGLPLFKYKNKFIGLNISLGLDFLRMSVDHGTAFEIYGKNIADHRGCQYMLEKAIQIEVERQA